jgi:hypothetical protein
MNSSWVHKNIEAIFPIEYARNCVAALDGFAYAPSIKPVFDELTAAGVIYSGSDSPTSGVMSNLTGRALTTSLKTGGSMILRNSRVIFGWFAANRSHRNRPRRASAQSAVHGAPVLSRAPLSLPNASKFTNVYSHLLEFKCVYRNGFPPSGPSHVGRGRAPLARLTRFGLR